MKRTMERLVFRVKLLTHGTDAGDTFWVGNLKHKDLSGQEISSQVRDSICRHRKKEIKNKMGDLDPRGARCTQQPPEVAQEP